MLWVEYYSSFWLFYWYTLIVWAQCSYRSRQMWMLNDSFDDERTAGVHAQLRVGDNEGRRERSCRIPPRSLYISYHSCLVRRSSLN
jgi:hypothetical protein